MEEENIDATGNQSSKYKIKLRYGGYFRLAKNSSTKRYCFGFQKCIYIDTHVYNLGIYEVCKSGENQAEVKYMDRRWDVSLDEKTCTCRVWQVRGIPCIHATAFITFTRDENWENFVDSYFTIEKFKLAYALVVAPMPARDQWVHMDIGEKIYPPAIKLPPGRPRKNRIKPNDEPKKRQKCGRCGEYGHRQKTCKNAASQDEESTSKRGREDN